MRRAFLTAVCLIWAAFGYTGLAQEPDHASRWEFTERFIREVWPEPAQLDC